MSNDSDIEIKGHNYDGIKEFDNPLPTWWLMTFYGTIIFAFLYVVHYESGSGLSMKKELELALSQIEAVKASAPSVVTESEESLIEKSKDPQMLAVGAEVFNSKCASCHGNELQGLIGPNLTDNHWIHGKGKLRDIMMVVKNGQPDKGMPPWDGILKNDEMLAVTAYIHSKHGTNPPNPKPPQGDAVE